ncbi:hypothetical protein GRI69_14325 [Erythrobacter vulgaris]|uniref:Uncharacterized protein n=1 Tax=Qipengyuania vulgaris TaxID=291985 RepID=A0A844XWW5_9SPHN|nr:hypothetical protein [Qipengyuania vulgaris]MXO49428.1 hypothetical protein [Qipengyuania vulgaris]
MATYQLRYAAPGPGDIKRLEFEARTLPGALDIAKKETRGTWAELCHEGRTICRLELVAETGVWLVGGPSSTLDAIWQGGQNPARQDTARQEIIAAAPPGVAA